MSDLDLLLASCRALPEPDPDAAPLAAALAVAGVRSTVAAWDDPAADWSRAPMTVLRSTWNYPQHPTAFARWLEATATLTELWNPLPVVRWNLHKRYLLDLAARGVPVVPTVLVRRGSREPLDAILHRAGWEDAVVKPAISAASYRTLRAGPGKPGAAAHLRSLAAERDVLVQRYLASVEGYGERAVIWVDGAVTHAVRKSPRFSGEDEAVSAAPVPVTPAEADLARRAVAAAPGPLLYARVDVAPGDDGVPVVMELELIEPSLFFPQGPEALERFVAAVRRRLGGLRRSPGR